MGVWVPPRVSRELREESRRREQQAALALHAEERWDWQKRFDAQLDRVVPGMKLARCPDPAPLDAVAQGARPGYWHVVWPGYKGGPLNVQPLTLDTDTGEPRLGGDGPGVEPGSWVFDALAKADLWSERANRERERIRREAEVARDRRLERERAERDADVLERYLAVSRTQVSLNRDTPWSQNAAGRRGARQ